MNLPSFPEHLLQLHGESAAGSVVGLLGSLAVQTGAVPVPDGTPAWLKVAAPLVGAILPFLFGFLRRSMAGESAGDRVRAAALRTKAGKLRQKTPPDEAGATALEDQADELDAKAAEKDAQAKS